MPDRSLLKTAAARYDAALGVDPPAFGPALREEAARALAGEIHYVDGQYVKIGRSGIDWTGAHIANHVWKERPKRFLWLPALMAGYAAERDERVAEAARDYLADWMRAHPAGPGWTMPRYDNGLNLAVRVAFFAAALAAFADSPAWDDAFLDSVLEDIGAELAFIGANLSPRGNFRMKQAMTLIECGLRLPAADGAAAWVRQGVAVMNDAARRQVLPDGAHIECTAGYHAWMTRLFEDCLKLQRVWPDLAFAFGPAMVAAMHDYALACTRPNGSLCGLHDSEGDWEGTHENAFAARRSAFRLANGLKDEPPPLCQPFPKAGQAFLRDGWGPDAAYLTFDATRWGGAHGHLSRNALQFHAHGRTLLLDPGRISYEMSDPLGPYAKSTRAHNTVNLNGWNQFIVNPEEFRTFHAGGYDCVSSRYAGGYWPGPYGWWFSKGLGHGLAAVHARHVFWVHGRWCLVIDEVTRWNEAGRGPDHEAPFLESNWQLPPGPVEVDAVGRRAYTRHPDSNLLLAFPAAPQNAVLELHEGESDPPRGWVRDPRRFAGTPAPQLSLCARPWKGHMETLAALLVPFRGITPPAVELQFKAGNPMSGQAATLELAWADGVRESVCWSPGLESMLGPVPGGETDGVLFYRRRGGAEGGASAAVDSAAADSAVRILKPGQGASWA